MAATWSVALLEILTLFLWTLSRAVSESNTTTFPPFPTLNATVPGVEGSTSVAAVIGRVAVALCVVGAIGVVLYLMKKKCPRGSGDGEHQQAVVNGGESRPLTGQSALSGPPSPQRHRDPRADSDHAVTNPEV